VKVGIVVPYSWSFWGAVVEHAELQAEALRKLGIETRTIMGNDPPGSFTRALHPRLGRHGSPPDDVIPVGRSVIVPANGSLPNIVLSPSSVPRIRRVLARERFDVLHVHEPMTPAICVATLAFARTPVVATWHASGPLGYMKLGLPLWGFLLERIDYRIAVSEPARATIAAWIPGEWEILPNGTLTPDEADPANREQRILFVGRQERRKGLHVLLRAWPDIRRRTGATLRIIGADPLAVTLLIRRVGIDSDGIEIAGFLSQEALTAELLSAKAMVAPSIGGESFGMVLTRAFACATAVVASDIGGYREVIEPGTAVLVPAGEPGALADAVVALLEDEDRRRGIGAAARRLAVERYSWCGIARRLKEIYEQVAA
jgi:phosphatidylinositol alpha-mannosyltransferase